ncbi:MAG: transglutaminase domain-containing protein, partial [Wenzhouxiangellaceae bacterium]
MLNLWWDRFVCYLVVAVFTVQTVTPLNYVSIPQPRAGAFTPQPAAPSFFENFGDLLNTIGDVLIPSAHAQQTAGSTAEYDLNDPYLIDQATALGNDPVAIFEFVRDEIDYEVYEGSLRGARGALWAGAGNSIDQASLLIALLKISGYDANYLQGSLQTVDAQTLVQAMFEPAPYRVIGFVPDGEEKADPVNDPELIAEASQHTAVEALIDGALVRLEPAFSGAEYGDSLVVNPITISSPDDAARHRVRIRVEAENYSLFTSILATLDGSPFQRQLVLDETFSAAELTGKSLALSHFVASDGSGGLLGSTFTHTYTPFLRIIQNDEDLEDDPIVVGQNYQEI